ncbi:MAG TPA: ring-cleaving dioxygenase [Aggregatilinea sp.]|uniref:ring-cleaving dioxygenase n=1 Tax=Aggregatilinea sp. TaxID=2806333 RepID=UPI002B55D2A0|nr:ring-cleaving dioxygenase [Aggregatilinea sp.]HML21924.1 ring-cleaving dioxygenase [Aggregatilinea sp.]
MAAINGIHHVSAITGDAQRNVDFYTTVLGLRMVKKTVNFDDPGTYHFYYGDETGTPGTLLTFFAWTNARRGRQGAGQTGAIAFAVPQESLDYWAERLRTHGVTVGERTARFGDDVLPFVDPDGQPLELIPQAGVEDLPAWGNGPVPAEYAVRGFHSVTLWESDPTQTERLLTEVFGFERVAQESKRTRYQTGDGGIGTRVDILNVPDAEWAISGAGTVHHVAWRTPDDDQQLEWMATLRTLGLNVTPVQPRFYFNSIYFREPGGVLFEIATDPPGMLVDEPLETLGQTLKLPPWYENQRAVIERQLPALRVPASEGGPRD